MLRLDVFNTGWIAARERRLYAGGGNAVRTLPVLSFVVEHPHGLFVFDAGLNAALATDAREYVGWLTNRLVSLPFLPAAACAGQMGS